MGREIRRVPPNYQHPKRPCLHWTRCKGNECYQPQYDETYEEASENWIEGFEKWQKGETLDRFEEDGCKYFWDWWGRPPEEEYYRTYKNEEATWYQVYQTVSEGCPVTPPFETQRELVEYLVEHGDFWAQERNEGGLSRQAAENFVYGSGYAPSMIVNNGKISTGIECCEDIKK